MIGNGSDQAQELADPSITEEAQSITHVREQHAKERRPWKLGLVACVIILLIVVLGLAIGLSGDRSGTPTVGSGMQETAAPTFHQADPNAFVIDIVPMSTIPSELQVAINKAKSRWERVIKRGFDTKYTIPANVDRCGRNSSVDLVINDLAILIGQRAFDEPGAVIFAGGCAEDADGHTRAGQILVDSADLPTSKQIEEFDGFS